MTNLKMVKDMIHEMNADELIEFCGGDSCENILCGLIGSADGLCYRRNQTAYSCAECIKRYLSQKAERVI